MSEKIIITGVGGFIGFFLSKKLLEKGGFQVIGIDNVNDYYDPNLKRDRISQLNEFDDFEFNEIDLTNKPAIDDLFASHQPDYVVNLAAQAGVRYSIENPYAYTETNVTGFLNILEGCRHNKVKHLLFASSSSVYGQNKEEIFYESSPTEHPISLYAATKKANEMMAHSYAELYKMPVTGLRFFTVYGPWGRPDMALFMFTKNILEGKPINVFNNGNMQRDFTFVEDIVEGISRLIHVIPQETEAKQITEKPDTSSCSYDIYNIGNGQPSQLMDYIKAIEETLGKKADINFMPLQAGDVPKTFAGTDKLLQNTGFKPRTNIQDGVRKFVEWYREYYNV